MALLEAGQYCKQQSVPLYLPDCPQDIKAMSKDDMKNRSNAERQKRIGVWVAVIAATWKVIR